METAEYEVSAAPRVYDLPVVEGGSRSQQWMDKKDPGCSVRKVRMLTAVAASPNPHSTLGTS